MRETHIIQADCNSPIGWLGGKTKLRTTIINCLPAHRIFVEVFSGSATVFFGKPPSMSDVEIVNDIHPELHYLWKVLGGHYGEAVLREFDGYLRSMPSARAAHDEWKRWDEAKLNTLNPAQRAFRFYYCIKNGFSSTVKGGYSSSPIARSRYNMNADLRPACARLNRAVIKNLDFRVCINKYNLADSSAFFFCDAPYFVADKTNYYDFVFCDVDHIALKELCDSIHAVGNTFMLTYDVHPRVLELYGAYSIYETDRLTYSAGDERGVRKNLKSEYVVVNYDLARIIATRHRKDDLLYSVADSQVIEIPGHIGLHRVK